MTQKNFRIRIFFCLFRNVTNQYISFSFTFNPDLICSTVVSGLVRSSFISATKRELVDGESTKHLTCSDEGAPKQT